MKSMKTFVAIAMLVSILLTLAIPCFADTILNYFPPCQYCGSYNMQYFELDEQVDYTLFRGYCNDCNRQTKFKYHV